MRSTLRRLAPRATTAGLGLVVLLFVGNAAVSEWNIRRLVRNEERVLHSQEVLTALEEVLSAVTGAETGERGYLITDHEAYLTSYQAAVGEAGQSLARLASLTGADPAQLDRAEGLRQRVDARLAELRQAIGARRAGGFDAARQSVSTNHGRQLMNEMRGLVADMKGREQVLLARRAAESARSAQVATLGDRVGAGLGVVVAGLALTLFRRDQAHRQRAEDLTRRLAAIVESSEDAIIGETLDGKVLSWNAGAERLYGYSAHEVLGRPVTLLAPPDHAEEIDRVLGAVRDGRHVQHFETRRVRKDGQAFDVSLGISPIKDAAGRVVGASSIARDITVRKRLQREVLEIAAQEQRRIGQDLHDGLGQELTGLAMLAQRLAGVLADQGRPDAGRADKIARGLEQALHDLRALSRGLVPVDLDAEGLMVALAQLCQRTSERQGLACTFRCSEPVRLLDNQAATHLYRMTQEAVTNAIRHGAARHVVISLRAEGDFVTLAITDDGRGITPADGPASGSGLRIMRYRAELIGARLTVGPAEPSGTCVVCTLGPGLPH